MIARDLSLFVIAAGTWANFLLEYRWKNLKPMPNIDPGKNYFKNEITDNLALKK